ncbi:DUF2839 domain-containing protein [Alkalinema sp. FACHB-956]|uniref:DUF2839 domain-containing protein n=1 Tax=Alkalinema sp. FACHB-956 TaxID=2692768 RepID=UPI00168485F3|nr:DUF2839 domain-containing protein [Alkalinema sp. FACHB-956]MBD2329019.1 DUF2839 domain-containing protein [Alkalinema sp. FACHB-956]
MGDSKRRKETLGENYGKEERFLPWLPVTKAQAEQLNRITITGAWIGIGILVAGWVTIRFIGPAFGWWQLTGLQ